MRCTRLQKTLSLHQYCAPIQSRSEYNRQGYYWTRITHRYRHWNKSANAVTPACIRTQRRDTDRVSRKGSQSRCKHWHVIVIVIVIAMAIAITILVMISELLHVGYFLYSVMSVTPLGSPSFSLSSRDTIMAYTSFHSQLLDLHPHNYHTIAG